MSARDFREKASKLLVSPTEHCRLCATQVNAYWRRRGYEVNARVEYVKFRADGNIPIVASDLVCGLPAEWRGSKVEAVQ